jgi:hypothetical protein
MPAAHNELTIIRFEFNLSSTGCCGAHERAKNVFLAVPDGGVRLYEC